MFGRKKRSKELHNTKAVTNDISTKDSDMTSGSRSTKSCGGKCVKKSGTNSCGKSRSNITKATSSNACSSKTTTNRTKACS